MEPVKVQVGRVISFKYSGVTIIGKVETVISGHARIRIHKDYISNAGKFHQAGFRQMFIVKDMLDVKLNNEYL